MIRCIDETAEQVRRNTGLSVTEIQIERVLRGESCSMAEGGQTDHTGKRTEIHRKNPVCSNRIRV